MTTVGMQTLPDLTGRMAVDESGDEVGTVVGVYLDNDTRQPEWAAVDVDGSELAVVPLAGASPGPGGGVQLAFGWEDIEEAPYRVSQLPREIADQDQAALRAHYGLGPSRRRRRRPLQAAGSSGEGGSGAKAAAATAADQGQEVASTAADQGRQVASTAADQGREVASAAAEQGQEVARAAVSQARDVAGLAREEVGLVRDEVSEEARSLLEEAKGQLQDQAETQVERLAGSLRTFGSQAQALAEGRPSQAGALPAYVRDAASRLEQIADDLDDRGLDGVVEDLQSFARRRPGVFLLGAAAMGFGVGRLLRAQSDDGEQQEAVAAPARPRRSAKKAGARRPPARKRGGR